MTYHANGYRPSPSRCGEKIEYRFYKQLKKILGQEAVSIEYDERDEQADEDSGMDVLNPHMLREEK